ncbi:MAG: hypothetical protein MUF81_12220, partial [Verrucomicrobia bacterium]|nr:hypothetical protein [Verrucomicrobiota bacterium]
GSGPPATLDGRLLLFDLGKPDDTHTSHTMLLRRARAFFKEERLVTFSQATKESTIRQAGFSRTRTPPAASAGNGDSPTDAKQPAE